MRGQFSAYSDYVPFTIVGQRSASGARLGGSPPQGVTSSRGFSYFLTVPLRATDDKCEISLFLSAPREEAAFEELYMRAVLEPENLEVVVHEESVRGNSSLDESWLPPAKLLRESPRSEGFDFELAYGGHKLGGVPSIMHRDSADVVAAWWGQGFRQVLQLSLLTRNDLDLSASWPFFDLEFHLLIRQVASGVEVGAVCWK